jgi:hypothetical protein
MRCLCVNMAEHHLKRPCAAVSHLLWGVRCRSVQVHGVLLDELMQQPQTPELTMVTDYETRSLR